MRRFRYNIGAALALAATQLGYVEAPVNRTKYGRWFGWDGVAWCAIWVSWVAAMVGSQLPPLSNKNGIAYVPLIKSHAIATGQWRSASSGYRPKPGDLIVFWFTNRPDHVGMVGPKGKMADGRVHSYEGNTNAAGSRTGGMVAELYRRSGIHGYVAVDDVAPGVTPPVTPPPTPQPEPAPTPTPAPQEDDDVAKLIRCNDPNHKEFGAVWAIAGLSRTAVTAGDYGRWLFLTGGEANQAQVDGPTFDFFMRNYDDITQNGAIRLTILYMRTVLDRIAVKLGLKL